MRRNQLERTKYNYGVAILRLILCLLVVFQHLLNWNVPNHQTFFWIYLRKFFAIHVPSFMVLSFLFVDYSIMSSDKLKKRLLRLLTPVIGWGMIYFVIYKILDIKFNLGLIHSWTDLFYQIIFGSKYNGTMWFHFALIVSTIIIYYLFKSFSKKNAIILSLVIGYISLFLQYTGIIYLFKDNMSQNYLYSIYGWFECIPYVSTGVLLCHTKILTIINNDQLYKKIFVIFSVSLIVLWLLCPIFIIPQGVMYPGYGNCIISFCVIGLFYMLPFDKLPAAFLRLIYTASSYTMGIYCIHRLASQLVSLSAVTNCIDIGSGKYVMFIYLICIVTCYILSKMPFKLLKKIVS